MPNLRPIGLAMIAAIYGCTTPPSDRPAAGRTGAAAARPGQDVPLDRKTMDGTAMHALRARRGPPHEHSLPSIPTDVAAQAEVRPELRAEMSFAAHHQPETQLLSEGGPVLKSPRIVPIFYAGDPATSTLVDFSTRLMGSHYWHQVVSEYGVGPGTVAPAIIRSDAAPATLFDTDIDAWLKAKLDAHDPSLPAPDANTIYALFFPEGTVVEFAPYYPGAPTSQSCKQFGAFHAVTTLASGQNVAYAVMPRCNQGYRNYTGAEMLTLAPSHEFAEAVTDPYVFTNSTYDLADFSGSAFSAFHGVENGDLCEFIPVSVAQSSDVGYPVQRLWSNRAAAAGHDPCLPALGPAYFNSTPVVFGTELYPGRYARGLSLPPGGTVTIDVELFSDAPTAPWTLSAKELDKAATLTFAFDQTEGKNGDKRRLTITRGHDRWLYLQAEIDSTLGGQTNTWPLVIGYAAPAAPPSTSFAAPHPPTAQLVAPFPGAPTLVAPRIVPVIFPGDPQAALITDFTARLTTGTYWARLAEYGIGAGSAAAPVPVSATSPATWTGADLAAWLGAKLDANDPAFPPADANTVYAIFPSAGTSVTTQAYHGAPVRTSCVDFDAYHDEAPLASGNTVPIVVVPRCASFGGLAGNDLLTIAAGRQLAQAAVNPFPVNYQGFSDVGFDGSELGVVYGAEVAALCSSSTVPTVRPADLGYAVPRLWSNAAAAASHDPCGPSTGDVYFNVAPIAFGTTTAYGVYPRGLSVEPGREKTIPLALFSDAPTGRWELSATTIPATDAVKAELDECGGKNGDIVHLTVKRKRGALQPVQVVIVSKLGSLTNQATLLVGR